MSIFDQDAPIVSKNKNKKQKNKATAPSSERTISKLSSILKTSGSAVVPQSSLDTETLAAEPGITPLIQAAISKLVNGGLMIKRSAAISKVVEKQFPNLSEASDHEATAVYGMINVVITTMIQEADIQEFRFQDDAGVVVESMLVANRLELEGGDEDLDDLDLPVTDGQSFLDDISGPDYEDAEDEDLAGAISERIVGSTDDPSSAKRVGYPGVLSVNTYHPEELANYMEGYAVVSKKDTEKQQVSILSSAAGALHIFGTLTSDESVKAQVYGLVPIEVQVSLSLGGATLVDADTDTNLSHESEEAPGLTLQGTLSTDVLSLPRGDQELPIPDPEAEASQGTDGGDGR